MNYFKISKFFLYLVPFGIIIVTHSTLFPFIVGKYVWFRSLIGLAFILFLLGLLFDHQADFYWNRFKKVIKSPLVIAVSVFVAAFLLATLLGIDPHFSFWSNFERGEGGLQMLNLYVFFMLLFTLFRSENDWRKFFWIFLLSALFMVFYGAGASLKFGNFIGPSFTDESFRFQGSIGNPAYVATYLVFSLFFAGYLLFSRFKQLSKGQKFILIISILTFGAFFFLAATRGSFVGLGAGIFAALLYLAYIKKPWRKPAVGALILLIFLAGSLIYFRDTPFVKSIPGSRIFDISFSAETFQHRAIMWGIAWEGLKERPVFGWGPESYIQIFYKHYSPDYFTPGKSYGAWFDRAHSVIFDYLAETGIVGFISYLGIFITFFWQFARSNLKNRTPLIVGALLLAIPVMYLVQGLALFDVSATYIPLFAFLAFSAFMFSTDKLMYQEQH